jgi:hypothetical protein
MEMCRASHAIGSARFGTGVQASKYSSGDINRSVFMRLLSWFILCGRQIDCFSSLGFCLAGIALGLSAKANANAGAAAF